jgi:hypothetical protein
MRALPFTVALLATLALTAGCASIKANLAETAKWQSLADRVTDGRVTVRLVPGQTGQYVHQTRTLDLGRDLTERDMMWLLAHELGHYAAGHTAATLENEIAANASGVAFLQAWGLSEADAVHLAEQEMLGVVRRGTRLTGASARAHNYCVEFRAVAAAHPAVSVPSNTTTLCPITTADK